MALLPGNLRTEMELTVLIKSFIILSLIMELVDGSYLYFNDLEITLPNEHTALTQ